MPRSSESVAALGGALAKAQAELVNPEKSLVATIPIGRQGAGAAEVEERSFRYASLASGLDIVHKTLSQHEIATVQTTAVEPATGLVNLTTMLVHASGEWIASDWPVCPISDLSSPRRMGAALTYARRYALFTLVGIAGEDDLDAPDLQERAAFSSPSAANEAGNGFAGEAGMEAGLSSKSRSTAAASRHGGRRRREHRSLPPDVLPSAQSGQLRDRLMAEIAEITSSEQAKAWAGEALPIKNTLAVADAEAIEQAFERRLIELGPSADTPTETPTGRKPSRGVAPAQSNTLTPEALEPDLRGTESLNAGVGRAAAESGEGSTSGVDKSVLTLAEPKRHRSKEHLRFVARQPCLVCGRTPSDPHHLRFAQAQALGRKVSDEFVVPLCRSHHRALHRVGDERGWWKAAGIEPAPFAQRLWQETRGTETSQPGSVGGEDKAAPSASAPVAAAMEAAAGTAIPGPCKASIDRAR